ncbi:sugar transporter [Aaosphaeria arxii CBS 175.79]|uniref:Sugar transporter n=1 Tax=Aaosphaeria arxii CBS 175.79 TaxID=1450172 RepID=A0A6A5XVE6_9PLEO|nr:sugar transporter [Aaosphaeria arxii CBS 175.79]KAF2016909.1 sugar transporter [Aaosphaeria arxii CBS 175.79]
MASTLTSVPSNPKSKDQLGDGAIIHESVPLEDAQDANAQEHDLTFWEALRLYPKGVFWSIAMSSAVIMEGYDTKLIGTLFAQPTFQKQYGVHVKGNSYQITAAWQTGLGNGSTVGQLMGLLLAGYLSERFGFRRTLLCGMVSIIGLIFIQFFAPNLIVLVVGQILFGIPLGLFQTTPVIYALEISPMCLRAYLTNYVNFCWAFGQIIATGLMRGVLSRTDEWAYRIPFGVQWVWPVIMIPIIYFAPESPWWLVRKDRVEEARAVVQKLTSPANVNFDVDKNVALMVVTTEYERMVSSTTSYKGCFEGVNLRRTLTMIGIYCIQTLNGNPLRGFSTYFLQQAGLPTSQAFNMTIVGFGVAILGGFFSWVLLPLFGRRTIYVNSLVLMFILMILVGGLGIPQAESAKTTYPWAIGSLLIISSFLYNCSIGPLTNTLCSEIPSALLRSKSLVIARWSYAVSTIIAGILTPYQLNPTAWNWGAKTGFFWAGGCLISIVFAFFYVPEPKGKTTAEMDILYEKRTPARHFSKAEVDLVQTVAGVENEKV